MLVAIEFHIFSDKFIDDEVFVREFGPVWRSIVEGTENLGSDFGSDLSEDPSLF